MKPTKSPWFVVVAAAIAVIVGVGAYVVAAPFTTARLVDPAVIEGWALPSSSGLAPLSDFAGDVATDSAAGLSTASIPDIDPASADVIRAEMRVALDELAAPAPDPSISPVTFDSDLRGALTVHDECAGETPPVGCPDGAPGTILRTIGGRVLELTASAVSGCTGRNPTASSLAFEVFATVPVSLTILYTVGIAERTLELETSAEDRLEWVSRGESTPLAHCIALSDLPTDWSDHVLIVGTDDVGNRVEIQNFVSVVRDDIVPPFEVSPISSTAVMISIPTVDVSSVRFIAFVVPFGEEPASCDFDSDATNELDAAFVVEERLTRDELDALNYQHQYVERHAAAFVVPEASTVSLCAGWVDAHGWDSTIPDHVYSQVMHSPDRVLPVVSVDDVLFTTSVGNADAMLTASIGGIDLVCGQWWQNSDHARPLCDYSSQPSTDAGWDAALVVTAQVSAFGSRAKRQYVLPVSPQLCGTTCLTQPTQFFDVPLESRDPCLGNGCARSRVGVVRLRVDWVNGRLSPFTSWSWDGTAAPVATAPVFNRAAVVELGPLSDDGRTQSASVVIATDREASMHLILERKSRPGWTNGRTEGVDLVIDSGEFMQSRVVVLDDLPFGQNYAITVELTDRDGNISVYSAVDYVGRAWPGGEFRTAPSPADIEVSMTVHGAEGAAVGFGNWVLEVGGVTWRSPETRRNRDRFTCVPEQSVVEIADAIERGGVSRSTYVSLSIEIFEPRYPVGDGESCSDRDFDDVVGWQDRYRVYTTSTRIELDDLLNGATVTFTSPGNYLNPGGQKIEVHLVGELAP